MAENTIEIEVELVGQKETLKGLDMVSKGAEGVGETFKGVGGLIGKTNKELGEGLSSVSDAIGESKDAFAELGGLWERILGMKSLCDECWDSLVFKCYSHDIVFIN